MAYRSSSYSFGGFQVTTWVKRLIIINAVLYLAVQLLPSLKVWLMFQPHLVLQRPWTPFTYMFVHGGFFHLLFNLLSLFFFGAPLEERWGSREFLKYYLICGLGGAALSFVFYDSAVLGASAAIYGVMLAFAMNWPDMPIHIWGIFPVKAKWLVTILVAFDLVSALFGNRDGVAHFAHLGGIAAGWIYLKMDVAGVGLFAKLKRMMTRPRLTVISGSASAPTERPRTRRHTEERVYDDVDRVLDKISAQGYNSLTPEEKKLLEDTSKRFRQN